MPKFRVRTLLIVVALVAVILGRWANYKHRAYWHHRELDKILISDLEFYLACSAAQGDVAESHKPALAAAQPMFEFQRYHLEMEDRYMDAYRNPWHLILFDPPAPPVPSEQYQRAFRARFLPCSSCGVLHSSETFPHPPPPDIPTIAQ